MLTARSASSIGIYSDIVISNLYLYCIIYNWQNLYSTEGSLSFSISIKWRDTYQSMNTML